MKDSLDESSLRDHCRELKLAKSKRKKKNKEKKRQRKRKGKGKVQEKERTTRNKKKEKEKQRKKDKEISNAPAPIATFGLHPIDVGIGVNESADKVGESYINEVEQEPNHRDFAGGCVASHVELHHPKYLRACSLIGTCDRL